MAAPGPHLNSESLPPLYAKWMAELLGGPIPSESRATCNDCAMRPTSEAQRSAAQLYFFDDVVKCCSYIPTLHNFLVGGILADDDPALQPGRVSVEKRIAEGIAVSPLGVRQPPVFHLLYHNSSQSFGRSRTLRCPHFLEESGACGIWAHRNSVCAAWFCKHVRGKVGITFWQDSLRPLLQVIEKSLASWCVQELQLSDRALRYLVSSADWTNEADITGDILDNRLDRRHYAQIWGEWLGREHEFFRRCAQLVGAMSWKQILEIGGPEARAFARLTRDAYRDLLSEDIPPALQVGSFQLVHIKNATARINPYSHYDPLDVPTEVIDLLQYFDGRPTSEAMAAIAAERNVRLEPGLVRKLVDFNVLVEPEKPNNVSC